MSDNFSGHVEMSPWASNVLLVETTSFRASESLKNQQRRHERHSAITELPTRADKIPHSLDTKLKTFLRQVCPLLALGSMAWAFTVEYCERRRKHGDLPESICSAFPNVALFIGSVSVTFSAFSMRERIFDKRHRLFHDIDPVNGGWMSRMILGSNKIELDETTMAYLMLGRGDDFTRYKPRGNFIVPIILASGFTVETYYGNIDAGLDGTAYLIGQCTYMWLTYFINLYNVKSVLIPFVFMCLQIGSSCKGHIGLWNKTDIALMDAQASDSSIIQSFSLLSSSLSGRSFKLTISF
jgi:hypothetical protein